VSVRTRLSLACILLFAGTSWAAAGEQEDLDKLRKRIGALQQELEKTSESKAEAADALRESERAISDSNRRLNELAQQQRSASRTLGQLQQHSEQLAREMQGQQALLASLLYQQYLGGRQAYLQLLLGNRDPNQTARDLQYYEYIARNRAVWLNAVRANLARMTALTEQAGIKSQEINALQRDEQEQRRHLEQDQQARHEVLTRISHQLKVQNREIGRLQHNEARLSQLVDRLGRMVGQSNAKPFESLKGKLLLPVKGKITNAFGARRPDGTMLWKGWFLRAPRGQAVHAVAAGQVVYADWLRGFGNLLIIDHGKGYMSLYGNNETLYKQVGETLHGGDTIASVGDSGGNENSGLYFELRHEGNPLDPRKWIAVR
jgi:septal ring factor EnvC (AmiA/AmiB activator)